MVNKKVPVFLTIKDGTPVVASYDKVVRITCDNEPGLSRHMLSVLTSIVYAKKIALTPFFHSFFIVSLALTLELTRRCKRSGAVNCYVYSYVFDEIYHLQLLDQNNDSLKKLIEQKMFNQNFFLYT
jgi:hypothetical protein